MPVHEDCEYPEPQQETGSYNYYSVFETPTSPAYEPRHIMSGDTRSRNPIDPNYDNGYSTHYEPVNGGCGEGFVSY